MMRSPLDLERLAVHIEEMMRTPTRGWIPSDEVEFQRRLPTARGTETHRLPDPSQLREWDDRIRRGDRLALHRVKKEGGNWTQMLSNMEAIRRRNTGASKSAKDSKPAPKSAKDFLKLPREARPDKWIKVEDGNFLRGAAELGDRVRVTNSKIAGTVEGSARVEKSTIGPGTKVGGKAVVRDSEILGNAVVEGNADIYAVKVSKNARVRGNSIIRNAVLEGGSWDGQEFDGQGGTFHRSWDQSVLDALTREEFAGDGPGDAPVMAIVQYFRDGGDSKGSLGKELDPDKLAKRVQDHVYRKYDKKTPWLGRGASRLDEFTESDFGKLVEAARREADLLKSEERKKKAMLHYLAKNALEDESLRPHLVPFLQRVKELRVASKTKSLRSAAVRFAYNCPDQKTRAVILSALKTIESVPEVPEQKVAAKFSLTGSEARSLIRIAYTTTNPRRKQEILGMLKSADYSPGFLKWVENKTFEHPETKNEVKFFSLPSWKRSEINAEWKVGKKQWAQKFKPPGLDDNTKLTPEKFKDLKKGDHLWISWTPGMLHKVLAQKETKTGKPFLEMALVDPKTGKEVQMRKLHLSQVGKPEHEMHVVPTGVKPQTPEKKPEPEPTDPPPKLETEPEKLPEPEDLPGSWKALKKLKESGLLEFLAPGAVFSGHTDQFSRGDKIKATSSKSGASIEATVLGHGLVQSDDGSAFVLANTVAGLTVIPVSGPKAEGVKLQVTEPAKKPKPKFKVPSSPKNRETELPEGAEPLSSKAVKPGDTVFVGGKPAIVKSVIPDEESYGDAYVLENGQKVNQLLVDGPADSPKAVYSKPTKAETKIDAPQPTGKYKDRKELVGAPLKEGKDSTPMSPPESLVNLAAPEGMAPDIREKTIQGMKGLTLGNAKKLLENMNTALKDPDGVYAKALTGSGYTIDGIKKLKNALHMRVAPYLGRTYAKPVLEIANLYDLESEDADELFEFRLDKPAWGKQLTDAQLFAKFLAHAKPETRERMQGMSLADFMIMYKSIMAEEDEEDLADAEAA